MVDTAELRLAFEAALKEHEFAFERFFLVRLLGIEFSYGPGTCRAALEVQPWMYNPRKSLHGGVIALGIDVSMGHLLNKEMGPAATVESKIQYFRPVAAGRVVFEASFLKRGRQIQSLQAKLLDDEDRTCAFATATWQLVKAV